MLRVSQSLGVGHLQETTLQDEGVLESFLRDLIANNRQLALAEIGEAGLVLLPTETSAHDSVRDRIDLLGLDTDGTAVIIELKRGKHKLQLLQAVSYAAMIASRPADWFKRQLTQDQLEDLQKTVSGGLNQVLNKRQRIVLIAEQFEPQVIMASRWLGEFGIGVRCIELRVTKDNTSPELRYMQFTQIFPSAYIDHLTSKSMSSMPAEFEKLLADVKVYTSARPDKVVTPSIPQSPKVANANLTDWEGFLLSLKRPEFVEFAKQWEENGEKILPDSDYRLVFPRTRERWRVQLRGDYAWVMQSGRFEIGGVRDEEFWKRRLSNGASVRVLRNGTRLHFNLYTKPDLDAFWAAITGELENAQFATS